MFRPVDPRIERAVSSPSLPKGWGAGKSPAPCLATYPTRIGRSRSRVRERWAAGRRESAIGTRCWRMGGVPYRRAARHEEGSRPMSGSKALLKAGAAAIALSAAIAGSAIAQQPDARIAGVWRGAFNDGYGTAVEFVLQA